MRKIPLLFLVISCLLPSCATQLSSPEPAEVAEFRLQKKLAHAAYKANRFYESLYHWKKLSAQYPDNREFKDRIFILSKLIKRRVNIYLDKANEAMKQGEFSIAINEFEKVLILDPTNNIAAKYLAQLNKVEKNRNNIIPNTEIEEEEIDKSTISNKQPANNNKEAANELADLESGLNYFDKEQWRKAIIELKKYIENNPGDDIAKNYLSNAHLKLSHQYKNKKQFQAALKHHEFAIKYSQDNKAKLLQGLKSLKSEIAHHYYIEGIKAYRTDKKLAISLWKKTLRYNPNHLSAKAKIEREETKKKK